MILNKLIPADVQYVAEHMREWDYKEISATRYSQNREEMAQELARDVTQFPDRMVGYTAGLEDPIACFGAWPMWPGMWTVWMFGTDKVRQIGLPLTKFVKNSMIPAIAGSPGFHRAECRSIEGHVDAQRWIEMLGFEREGGNEAYGRGGEDFHVYVWS